MTNIGRIVVTILYYFDIFVYGYVFGIILKNTEIPIVAHSVINFLLGFIYAYLIYSIIGFWENKH